MIATIIIGLIIIIGFIFGIKSMIKTSKQGCCDTGDTLNKIKVSDKNKSHYPYKTLIKVEDMHCDNCKTKVENTLNQKEGTYASVNLNKKIVTILSKEEPNIEDYKSSIIKIGYHPIIL